MANNHEQFIEFNESIKLSESKKNELRKNRDTLRDKIRKYFEDEKSNQKKPKFSAQGSFMMNTTVNPIVKEEFDEEGNVKKLYQYDLDDGVYFIDKEENRKSESTYHNWIFNAVKDHTTKGAEKKSTCVRVLYADGHNIDLPIYFKAEIENEETIPELAHKSKKYTFSDPREFYRWFNNKADEQLKRIVRYLKAWRDKQNNSYSTKIPSGLVLTILATNHYIKDDRDDISFRDTLQEIQKELDYNFICERPTTEVGEDLLEKYSENHFMDRLSKLIDSANKAIEHTDNKEACKKWQKHLGDRFSCSNIKEINSYSNSPQKKAIVNVNASSA